MLQCFICSLYTVHFMENYISFFQTPWKIVFPKKLRWNMIFLVLSGKKIFFFTKIWSYPLDGKWKMIKKILKKYMEIWYFLYIHVGITNLILRSLPKTIKDDLLPQKYTQRWLTIILHTLMVAFIDVFICCFPAEKYRKLNI